MKYLIAAVVLTAMLAGVMVLGESSPTANSEIQYKVATGELTNRHPGEFLLLVRDFGGTTVDSLLINTTSGVNFIQPYDGVWYLGTTGSRWDRIYGDTLILSDIISLGGDALLEFVGPGLRNNSGVLEVYLPNAVTTDWITNQTIIGQDIDSTSANIAFQHAFDSTTADTMRMLMWRSWIETHLGPYPISPVAPTDGQVPSYDQAKDSVVWVNNAAAGSGDNITVDTGNGTRMNSTDWVVVGDGVEKSGDSIIIAGGGSGTGRFGVAADSLFNAKGSSIDSLEAVDLDSLQVDKRIYFGPGGTGTIDSVAQITSPNTAEMIINGTGNAGLLLQYGSTGGITYYENTTAKLRLDNDSLKGLAAGGNVLWGFKYGEFADSGATGGMIIAGQRIRGDSSLVSEGELEDSLDFYLLMSNENVQKLVTRDTLVFPGATPGDTALKIIRYNSAGQDSTVILIPGIGIIRGTIQTATVFDSAAVNSYIRFGGTGTIKDALAGSFDTVQVDKKLRLNGATSGYLTIAASGTTTPYELFMPTAIGGGGYLYFNSLGIGSFAAGAGGVGADTVWSATAAVGGRADSIEYISRGGDTIFVLGDSLDKTNLYAGQNTGFRFMDPFMTLAGENISDDSSLASEREVRAYLDANIPLLDSLGWRPYGATQPKDTLRWYGHSGLAGQMFWTLSGADTLTFKPGTATGTMILGNEGLTTADSLDVLSGVLKIAGKPWPSSYTNGYQLTIDGSGNLSWGAAGGAGSGTQDSLYFNTAYTTTGSQYSIMNNALKVRAGGGAVITREDSTTFDLMRIKAAIDNSTIDTTAAGLLQVKALGVGASHLATSAVTNTKIGTNAVSLDKMDDASVGSAEIVNGSIVAADLNQMSAATNQLMKWNGSAWVAANVDSTMIPDQGISLTDLRGTGATAGDFIVWNGSQYITSSGGAGTGTITSVGSVTSGGAFSSVATSQAQWLGMQNAVGWPRFYFDSTSVFGGHGRDLAILGANLQIGGRTDNGKTGLVMASDTSVGDNSDYGIWVHNRDSASGSKTQIQLLGTTYSDGTNGGDIGLLLHATGANGSWSKGFGFGIDVSDGKRLKMIANDDGTIGTNNDYFAMDSTGKAVFWGGLYLNNEAMTVTDSQAATLRYARTGGYQTEYIGMNGGNIYWTPEPMATVNKFLTNPWIDTASAGSYSYPDSLPRRAYLYRASDTTANNDSLFVVTQWTADVACSLLAVNYCGKTSSGTAATSSLDSLILYVNGTRTQGVSVAYASTVLDTVAIDFTNKQLAAGDDVVLVARYILGNDAFADCKWMNIERRKR